MKIDIKTRRTITGPGTPVYAHARIKAQGDKEDLLRLLQAAKDMVERTRTD